MTQETNNLAAYIATLLAIVLLSKIGGTGADLAIMTGLVGVLGMLVGARKISNSKSDTPAGTPNDPLNTKDVA